MGERLHGLRLQLIGKVETVDHLLGIDRLGRIVAGSPIQGHVDRVLPLVGGRELRLCDGAVVDDNVAVSFADDTVKLLCRRFVGAGNTVGACFDGLPAHVTGLVKPNEPLGAFDTIVRLRFQLLSKRWHQGREEVQCVLQGVQPRDSL